MDNITPAELEVLQYALSLLEENWNESTFDGYDTKEAAFISISCKLAKLQQAQWKDEDIEEP